MESRKCTICGNENNDKMLLIYSTCTLKLPFTVINFAVYSAESSWHGLITINACLNNISTF